MNNNSQAAKKQSSRYKVLAVKPYIGHKRWVCYNDLKDYIKSIGYLPAGTKITPESHPKEYKFLSDLFVQWQRIVKRVSKRIPPVEYFTIGRRNPKVFTPPAKEKDRIYFEIRAKMVNGDSSHCPRIGLNDILEYYKDGFPSIVAGILRTGCRKAMADYKEKQFAAHRAAGKWKYHCQVLDEYFPFNDIEADHFPESFASIKNRCLMELSKAKTNDKRDEAFVNYIKRASDTNNVRLISRYANRLLGDYESNCYDKTRREAAAAFGVVKQWFKRRMEKTKQPYISASYKNNYAELPRHKFIDGFSKYIEPVCVYNSKLILGVKDTHQNDTAMELFKLLWMKRDLFNDSNNPAHPKLKVHFCRK